MVRSVDRLSCRFRLKRRLRRSLVLLSAAAVLLAADCAKPCADMPGRERAFEAAWRGDLDAMRELLKSNPGLAGATGCPAARGAFEWLLDRAAGRGPATLLHVAARQGYDEMARLLIANGADVRRADALVETPLHLAARYGHDRVIDVLLQAGADVNARKNGGLTALHLAASNGEFAAVKRLLLAHADVNARDNFGETPIASADAHGHADVVRLLKAYGGRR